MKKSDPLYHPLFFIDTEEPKDFFPDENVYYKSSDMKHRLYPWNTTDESVKDLISQWHDPNFIICHNFKQRQKDMIQRKMVKALSLFMKLLIWSNGSPVTLNNLKKDLGNLSIKPINIVDRLSFIMEKPSLYPSFLQLSELFVEQHKAYYRNKVMVAKKE